MQIVRQLLKGQGLSYSATGIILQSWRDGTRKQYTTYLLQWKEYCSRRKIDTFSATVAQGINFLRDFYEDNNLSYSAINTALSPYLSLYFHLKDTRLETILLYVDCLKVFLQQDHPCQDIIVFGM